MQYVKGADVRKGGKDKEGRYATKIVAVGTVARGADVRRTSVPEGSGVVCDIASVTKTKRRRLESIFF